MSGISNTKIVTNCAVDGAPLQTHLRCEGCTILVGPAHLFNSGSMTTATISGESKQLCPLCYQDCLDAGYQSWREFYEGKKPLREKKL